MTDPQATGRFVRTSVLLLPETDQALRDLARKGKRPLAWEIRHALQKHVENEKAAA